MTSYIRDNVAALHAYTPGEQPREAGVVKLNTNENPYPPAPSVLAVLAGISADALRMYPDPVCTTLREAIAEVHGCQASQVFCGNGSDEILSLCIRAFVPDHGRIGYWDPSYSLYPVLAGIADVGVEPLPLAPDFSWPAMPSRYDVPLFFWTNPNAPTSLQCAIDGIADYADRSAGVVVVDEAYADFADTNALGLVSEYPNVIVTRTFSKSYSLAGARLGYAIGPQPLIEALFKIKDAYNINRLTQELGRLAMTDQAHMRANVERIRATRTRVSQSLAGQGWQVLPSQTNFLWARPPNRSAAEWFEELRSQRIFVRFFPSAATRDYLRITIGTDEQMDVFLQTVDITTAI